jgi:hypothetical protein
MALHTINFNLFSKSLHSFIFYLCLFKFEIQRSAVGSGRLTIQIKLQVYERYKTARWGDKKLKEFKFMLLDGSHCLHISESMVSISYTFHNQRALMS